ncbi:putative ATP-grasp-modified RiPP [Streptosporangium sp. NPDC051022]|uniref:putative ATP-grasp-modified RiPP n=1 Tax=Streptosporangium sp. NPDC051022 TaxID=3155752 RepID=UPI0034386221
MNNQHNLPWGLTQTQPFPAPAPAAAGVRVELDPATQMGVYRDTTGQIIEAGKHGTNKQTSKKEKTRGGGDGSAPSGSDEVTVTDYSSD